MPAPAAAWTAFNASNRLTTTATGGTRAVPTPPPAIPRRCRDHGAFMPAPPWFCNSPCPPCHLRPPQCIRHPLLPTNARGTGMLHAMNMLRFVTPPRLPRAAPHSTGTACLPVLVGAGLGHRCRVPNLGGRDGFHLPPAPRTLHSTARHRLLPRCAYLRHHLRLSFCARCCPTRACQHHHTLPPIPTPPHHHPTPYPTTARRSLRSSLPAAPSAYLPASPYVPRGFTTTVASLASY